MIVYNLLNPSPITYERTTQPSMTIPDQTMSMREILTRYARGIPMESSNIPIYEGEDGIDVDLKTLDISERTEIVQKFKEELQTILNSQKSKQPLETPKKDLKIDNTDSTQSKGEEGPLE